MQFPENLEETVMKRAFLTGGNGDIGSAIKAFFVKQGFEVIAPQRQELDLTKLSDIATVVQKQEHFDVVIHCAGINFPKPFAEIDDEDFMKTMIVNAFSFYKLISELERGQKIKQNGCILAISSIYGLISRRKRFAYAASKHSLLGMVQTLALELGEKGIRTNALAPGFVDTRLTRQNNDPETIRHFEKKIPLGRLAKPEDIAKIAYFLCSEENQYINGQLIVADGGYTVGGFET